MSAESVPAEGEPRVIVVHVNHNEPQPEVIAEPEHIDNMITETYNEIPAPESSFLGFEPEPSNEFVPEDVGSSSDYFFDDEEEPEVEYGSVLPEEYTNVPTAESSSIIGNSVSNVDTFNYQVDGINNLNSDDQK